MHYTSCIKTHLLQCAVCGAALGKGIKATTSLECGCADADGSQEIRIYYPNAMGIVLAPDNFPCPIQRDDLDL